jgi:hypothetical protein
MRARLEVKPVRSSSKWLLTLLLAFAIYALIAVLLMREGSSL